MFVTESQNTRVLVLCVGPPLSKSLSLAFGYRLDSHRAQATLVTVCSTYKSVFKVSSMSASVHLLPCEDNKICSAAGSMRLFIPSHTFALDPIMLP